MLPNGPQRKAREKPESSDNMPSDSTDYTLIAPAMVCSACVETIKAALTPHVFLSDPILLKVDLETKKITITVSSTLEVNTLLNAIKESGYDAPPPFQLESDNSKRARGIGSKCSADREFNAEEVLNQHTGAPILHRLQITTARTNACLEGIVEKFSRINLQSQHEGGVVSITIDPSVSTEQLQQAIFTMTGHRAEPVRRNGVKS